MVALACCLVGCFCVRWFVCGRLVGCFVGWLSVPVSSVNSLSPAYFSMINIWITAFCLFIGLSLLLIDGEGLLPPFCLGCALYIFLVKKIRNLVLAG